MNESSIRDLVKAIPIKDFLYGPKNNGNGFISDVLVALLPDTQPNKEINKEVSLAIRRLRTRLRDDHPFWQYVNESFLERLKNGDEKTWSLFFFLAILNNDSLQGTADLINAFDLSPFTQEYDLDCLTIFQYKPGDPIVDGLLSFGSVMDIIHSRKLKSDEDLYIILTDKKILESIEKNSKAIFFSREKFND